MAVQEAPPFTALTLVPDIDGPDSETNVTCIEAWGMCETACSAIVILLTVGRVQYIRWNVTRRNNSLFPR